MKELIYRNMLGNNPRKHEISIEETSVRMRVQVSKKRSCKYFIRETFTSDNKDEIRYWIEMRKLLGCRKECHILRCADSRTGENKVVCKIRGEFFAVSGNTAYKVVYVNEIKVKFRPVYRNEKGVL